MSKTITVTELSKTYKDGKSQVTALHPVSFELQQGEDLAIVGPSGSGKTTLLQLMGGLSKPSTGSVNIYGQDVATGSNNDISQFRNKTMGFVFQLIYLQDYLTAVENVMLPMLIDKKPKPKAKKRAMELLDSVGLADRASHKPSAMSGGEMQRVAVARALANNPKVIFADEPTGKLDKKNSENIIELLTDIAKKEKMSVIMITHDESIAKKFNNVLWLEHGEVKKFNRSKS